MKKSFLVKILKKIFLGKKKDMFRNRLRRAFSFEKIHGKMQIRDSYLKESYKFNEQYEAKCKENSKFQIFL